MNLKWVGWIPLVTIPNPDQPTLEIFLTHHYFQVDPSHPFRISSHSHPTRRCTVILPRIFLSGPGQPEALWHPVPRILNQPDPSNLQPSLSYFLIFYNIQEFAKPYIPRLPANGGNVASFLYCQAMHGATCNKSQACNYCNGSLYRQIMLSKAMPAHLHPLACPAVSIKLIRALQLCDSRKDLPNESKSHTFKLVLQSTEKW